LIIYGDVLKQFSFPKKRRLVSNRQFKAVLAQKLRVSDDLLILYVARNDCGYARLGVSVGKSCGGAVVRNRLKRLMREAFRQNQGRIAEGLDYLLMISPQWSKRINGAETTGKPVKLPTFKEVRTSFLALVTAGQKRVGMKGDNQQENQ